MTFSDDNKLMDKMQMLTALHRLNEKLQSSDETGELILFGGAVMCLVYGSRGYTRDIDAVFEPWCEGLSGSAARNGSGYAVKQSMCVSRKTGVYSGDEVLRCKAGHR
jgi:hypothetical protein